MGIFIGVLPHISSSCLQQITDSFDWFDLNIVCYYQDLHIGVIFENHITL